MLRADRKLARAYGALQFKPSVTSCNLASAQKREHLRPRVWRLPFVIGVDCPVCRRKMTRERTPSRYRFLRFLLPHHTSYRLCVYCKVRLLAFHGVREEG